MSASGGIMVTKIDLQTYTSEFESQWVLHSYNLAPHLIKKKQVNYLLFGFITERSLDYVDKLPDIVHRWELLKINKTKIKQN